LATFLPIFYAKSHLLPVPFKTHAAQNGNLGYGNKDSIWLGKLSKSKLHKLKMTIAYLSTSCLLQKK
jgi:hypothetical protein